MNKNLKLMIKFQKDEATASKLYGFFAKRIKDSKNKSVLEQISRDEASHALIWKQYTQKEVRPSYIKFVWYAFLTYLLGYTFVIKLMENGEYAGVEELNAVKNQIPEVEHIIAQEEKHEKELINMLDEERLNYVGAMVLGLNDALVELTGTIAGLTFVLANTRLTALAGVITGIAATLSMAASNYLAERAEGNPKALKASIYTGIAYLFTVILLVFPYLMLPPNMYLFALLGMICIAIFIIFGFNYYIAVVRSEKFLPKFIEMAGISLSVAFISFLIGILAKKIFNIDVE